MSECAAYSRVVGFLFYALVFWMVKEILYIARVVLLHGRLFHLYSRRINKKKKTPSTPHTWHYTLPAHALVSSAIDSLYINVLAAASAAAPDDDEGDGCLCVWECALRNSHEFKQHHI